MESEQRLIRHHFIGLLLYSERHSDVSVGVAAAAAAAAAVKIALTHGARA